MLDTAVWGSGETEQGRFKANKAIASATIEELPGGIEIIWSPGDIVNLTGQLASITPIYTESGDALYRHQFERRFIPPTGSPTPWGTLTYYSRLISPAPSLFYGTFSNGNKYAMLRVDVRARKGTTVADGYYTTSNLNTESLMENFSAYLNFTSGANAHQTTAEMRNFSYSLWAGSSSQTVTGYRVESTTGQSSERNTTTAPTVNELTAGCQIVIIHEDTEVIEIPLDYCPDWVNLLDSQACPAGSCECIHDGHKCCYDSNTGALIKVIPI